MKSFSPLLVTLMLLNVFAVNSTAQSRKNSIERGSIFTVSGIGLGITGGNTRDVITPKVSTKIGFDASIGKQGLFIYPSVNFLIFKYSQKVSDPDYPYSISLGGRTAITSLTIPLGFRKSFGNFNISAFAGPGASLILEPRLEVDTQNQSGELSDRDKYSISLTAGIGAEYVLGQFALFAEASHLYNLADFQDRQTFIFPVFVGFKSDISNVFK
jgi:hypothetical protein